MLWYTKWFLINICPLPPEHHHSVYCDAYDTGAMFVYRTAAGSMGFMTVVREVWYIPRPRRVKDFKAG